MLKVCVDVGRMLLAGIQAVTNIQNPNFVGGKEIAA